MVGLRGGEIPAVSLWANYLGDTVMIQVLSMFLCLDQQCFAPHAGKAGAAMAAGIIPILRKQGGAVNKFLMYLLETDLMRCL